MTQQELADRLGIDRTTLNTMLNSSSTWPRRWQEIIDLLEDVEIVVLDKGEIVEPSPNDLVKVARKERAKDIE